MKRHEETFEWERERDGVCCVCEIADEKGRTEAGAGSHSHLSSRPSPAPYYIIRCRDLHRAASSLA